MSNRHTIPLQYWDLWTDTVKDILRDTINEQTGLEKNNIDKGKRLKGHRVENDADAPFWR